VLQTCRREPWRLHNPTAWRTTNMPQPPVAHGGNKKFRPSLSSPSQHSLSFSEFLCYFWGNFQLLQVQQTCRRGPRRICLNRPWLPAEIKKERDTHVLRQPLKRPSS
jgi:hypothetical protein